MKKYYLLLSLLLPIKAVAEIFVVDEIQYEVENLDGSTATALFCNSELSGSVVVPSSITVTIRWEEDVEITRTYIVTSLRGTFQNQTKITSVSIPSSVREMMGTFINCSSLTSVNLPNSISAIGRNTFQGCTSLTSIAIPSSVKTIEGWAFNGSGLRELVLPEGVETIEECIVGDCWNLTKVTLPNSLKSIDRYAFFNAFGLTTIISNIQTPFDISEDGLVFTSNQEDNPEKDIMVYVPANTLLKYKKTIGWNRRWTNGNRQIILEEINSSSYTDENDVAYTYSPNATKAYVKEGNWSFDTNEWTLASPNVNRDIVIPETITVEGKSYTVAGIGSSALGGSMAGGNVKTVTLPSTIEYIDEWAFRGQISVFISQNANPSVINDNILDNWDRSRLFVPDGTVSAYQNTIGWSNFHTISNLSEREVTFTDLDNNVVYEGLIGGEYAIVKEANNPQANLILCNTVEIGNEGLPVTKIAEGAFSNCQGLTSVIIPEGVTEIGERAFDGCDNLENITVFWENPIHIASSVFSNYDAMLIVPDGKRPIYKSDEVWCRFLDINDGTIEQKDEESGVSYIIGDDDTATITDTEVSNDGFAEIPETIIVDNQSYPVSSIEDYAFANRSDFTSVTIPENIETIGEGAFAGCSGLNAIYSYAEEPIALANAKVRTRAESEKNSAVTVFAKVDKETCILYVPKNSSDKYRQADGWGEFQNIVEIESEIKGDANNDGNVDNQDIDAITNYIINKKMQSFIFKNADINGDKKVNAADIVDVINKKQ